jgi:hypothetical protein
MESVTHHQLDAHVLDGGQTSRQFGSDKAAQAAGSDSGYRVTSGAECIMRHVHPAWDYLNQHTYNVTLRSEHLEMLTQDVLIVTLPPRSAIFDCRTRRFNIRRVITVPESRRNASVLNLSCKKKAGSHAVIRKLHSV